MKMLPGGDTSFTRKKSFHHPVFAGSILHTRTQRSYHTHTPRYLNRPQIATTRVRGSNRERLKKTKKTRNGEKRRKRPHSAGASL